MAGICASITFDGTPVSHAELAAMAAAAPHRSADGTGIWTGPGAGLCYQRRVLLPEDEVDEQPLMRGGLVLVADARLDNRDELVPVLSRSGLLGDVDVVPDSEILLSAYRLWGQQCPERLIGDFAFVIWDSRSRMAFAARDPLGMRALYVRWEARRRLVLATELKQVLAAPGVPREIDERAIAATLAGPYLPPSSTVYAGIEQLAPGHAMAVTDGGRRIWRCWAPHPRRSFRARDEVAAAEAFRAALERAVLDRLRSVRPVGIFLSGGMDSGSVASMTGRLLERGAATGPVHTYSYAFEELPDSDERAVSDHIVDRFGFHGTAVPADSSWPLARYPQHAPDEDDPYSWVYQALVERTLDRCRDDGVGVVLGGERGDEVTGDWVHDELGLITAGRLSAAVADLRSVAAEPGTVAWRRVRREVLKPAITARWPRLSARLVDRRRGRPPWPPWVPDAFAKRVDLGDVVADAVGPARFDGPGRTQRYHRIFLSQATRIAVLHERTRARWGLGSADPYSDRRLIELVLSMPQWLVQRRTQPKALARAAMIGVMPEPARVAARKTIPESLFDRAFRDRAVPLVEDLLRHSQAAQRGWLDEEAARGVYRGYVATGDSGWDFWWPLTVEMWLRRWWT